MSIIYCDLTATGINDGSDWENAFVTLNAAITAANSSIDSNSTIYISSNIYSISTVIIKHISFFGGINTIAYNNNINKQTIINVSSTINIVTNVSFNNIEINSSASLLFNNSYELYLNHCSIYGINIINGNGINIINNSNLICSNTCISSSINRTDISNSNINALTGIVFSDLTLFIYDCCIISTNGIIDASTTSSIVSIKNSIIKSITKAIKIIVNSTLSLLYSTVDSLTSLEILNSNKAVIENCIILGNQILNVNAIDPKNVAFFPFPIGYDEIKNLKLTKRPDFKNINVGDYTPLFGVGETLNSFELTRTDNKYIQNVEAQSLIRNPYDISNFKFLVNNIFVLSDYMNEIKFAPIYTNNSELEYSIYYTKKVFKTNMIAQSAFPYTNTSGEVSNIWPYEWDYVKYDNMTTNSVKSYIVPRSIIDITSIIQNEFFSAPNIISLIKLDVTTLKDKITTGIGYDYYNSANIRKILWTLDIDQNLEIKDLYNNIMYAKYNLLSKPIPVDYHYFIKPSGLIPFGAVEDGYLYQFEDNNNIQLKGVNDNYDFEWLPTDLTHDYKLNGLVIYKDNLYILAKYTIDNSNALLIYPTNGVYTDYITDKPTIMKLGNDDQEFTDITILEDGNLLLTSKNNRILYKYILKYDYAIKQGTSVTDTMFILREYYDNISLSGII